MSLQLRLTQFNIIIVIMVLVAFCVIIPWSECSPRNLCICYSALMGLTPYSLENVLTTSHDISWLKLLFTFIPEADLLCKNVQEFSLHQKEGKRKDDFNLDAGTSSETMVFIGIFMHFTLYCLQEETKAVLEIRTTAAQASATESCRRGSGFCLPVVFWGTLFLYIYQKSGLALIRWLETSSLRIPHSSVVGALLKVMEI